MMCGLALTGFLSYLGFYGLYYMERDFDKHVIGFTMLRLNPHRIVMRQYMKVAVMLRPVLLSLRTRSSSQMTKTTKSKESAF